MNWKTLLTFYAQASDYPPGLYKGKLVELNHDPKDDAIRVVFLVGTNKVVKKVGLERPKAIYWLSMQLRELGLDISSLPAGQAVPLDIECNIRLSHYNGMVIINEFYALEGAGAAANPIVELEDMREEEEEEEEEEEGKPVRRGDWEND